MNTSWENRQWWIWVLGVILMGSGYFAGVTWPARFDKLLSPSLEQLRKLATETNAFHSPLRAVGVILLHNLFAAIVVMVISGILTAGLYPAWAIWMNGVTMGYVVATGAHSLGVADWRILVFGLLPHGVFELPAFIWCGVLGIHLGYVAFHRIWDTLFTWLFRLDPVRITTGMSFRHEFLRTLRLLPYPIGLLLIAATIEGTVTPHLIQFGVLHR